MTADLLRSRSVARLTQIRADTVGRLRLCKPRAPLQMQDGAVIPSATPDEIALYAVDLNATVDALDRAIEIIQDEFKKMTSPEEPAVQQDTPNQARKLYG